MGHSKSLMSGGRSRLPVYILGVLMVSMAIGGCLGLPPPPNKSGRPGGAGKGQAMASGQSQNLQSDAVPKAAYSSGLFIILHEFSPSGKILPFLRIHAASGTVKSTSERGILFNAHALIYKAGQPLATVVAPWVEFSNKNREVYAKGGVTLRSLKEPITTLNADRITWYGKQSIIVAEGNVRAVQLRKGQPAWVLQNVQHLTVDTAFNQFHVP